MSNLLSSTSNLKLNNASYPHFSFEVFQKDRKEIRKIEKPRFGWLLNSGHIKYLIWPISSSATKNLS